MRALAAILASTVCAAAVMVAQSPSSGDVQSWPIRDSMFMLVGPGANTTVQIGRDGTFVVDTQTGGCGR